jgi:MFS family permease
VPGSLANRIVSPRSRGGGAAGAGRAVFGACALGLATGWQIANTGAVAEELAGAYGVSLAAVGFFTTALFIVHLVMQIPGGRAADRFGPRRSGLAGLAVMALGNALALAVPDPALAVATRALIGVGTGLAFVAGADYVRAAGASPAAQGLYGGVSLAGGGLAIAVVPQAEDWLGWRSAYLTALVVALAALLALAAGPAEARRGLRLHEEATSALGLLRDTRLYRLALLYAASFGLSVVVGNWVVTLLVRAGGASEGAAGAVGSLTLLLGIVSRPLGGWILRHRPSWTRPLVALSLLGGALGTGALALASPLPLAAFGAALVGFSAGIPFAPVFAGAAETRPGAPATAVGVVNGAAALTIVVGSPLLGLAFSLPGAGRLGFAAVAGLWAACLLALPSEGELAIPRARPATESR